MPQPAPGDHRETFAAIEVTCRDIGGKHLDRQTGMTAPPCLGQRSLQEACPDPPPPESRMHDQPVEDQIGRRRPRPPQRQPRPADQRAGHAQMRAQGPPPGNRAARAVAQPGQTHQPPLRIMRRKQCRRSQCRHRPADTRPRCCAQRGRDRCQNLAPETPPPERGSRQPVPRGQTTPNRDPVIAASHHLPLLRGCPSQPAIQLAPRLSGCQVAPRIACFPDPP